MTSVQLLVCVEVFVKISTAHVFEINGLGGREDSAGSSIIGYRCLQLRYCVELAVCVLFVLLKLAYTTHQIKSNLLNSKGLDASYIC